MKILLINLDRSKDRLEQQIIQFKDLDLEFERLSAVSIHDFSEADYKKMAFGGQRPMKQSELACFLSHKKAWEYVIEHNEPCVILEDDAVLASDIDFILSKIKKLKKVDHVTLEVVGRKKTVANEASYSIEDYKLFKLYQDRNGAGGYVLFPSGAKKLLSFLENRSIGLADEVISSCRALQSYQLEPAAVVQGCICPLYGIKTTIDQGSVIGQVKNNETFTLSLGQKFLFKKNRISAQLVLAWYYLKYLLIGSKRLIEVDRSKFTN